MGNSAKIFFDLFFTKKFSFSVLIICLFLSFAACGGGGDDSDNGKDKAITITIPGSNVKLTMLWIPDGTFTMGSSESDLYAMPQEKPQHHWQIYLSETMANTILEVSESAIGDSFSIYFRNFKIAEIDANEGKLINRKISRRS